MHEPPALSPSVATKVEARRIDVFVDRQYAGALTSPLGTFLVGWIIFQSGTGLDTALIWLLVINITEVLILLAARRHMKAPDRLAVLGRTKREMLVLSLLIGLAWGSSVWYLGPGTEFYSYLFIFTVLMGVAGVCQMIFAPDRLSMIAFYAGLLLFPAAQALLYSPRSNIEMALGLTVMFVLMIQYGLLAGKQLISEFETNARLEATLAQLRESQQHLAAVFATTPVALMISTPDEGRIIDINQAGLEMTASDRDAVVGKTVGELGAYVAPGQRAGIVAELQRNGHISGFEGEFRRPDGVIRTCLMAARLSELNGKPVVFTALQDITDRKRAEYRLRELSQAVDQSPSSVCITDIDGTILQANEAFIRNGGYSRDEVMGGESRVAWADKLPPAAIAELRETLAGGANWSGEFTHRHKDGSESIEFVRVSPIREANVRITRYLLVGEDITEKKRMAVELDAHRHHLEDLVQQRTRELQQARTQADAANVAKSAFLANMSHEIRTPMNAIIGMVHMIKRRGVAPEQAERLEKIDTASQHLLEIISAVLDLSKIEAGKFSIDEAEVDVAGIAANVVSILAEKARARNVALRIEQQPLPANLLGDQTRLQQALLNYAVNALKFTEAGSVTLRISAITETADSALLRFEVEDSGIGIDPETLARLFTPFEQGDNSMTRRFGGTGLGLVITRHLAELMGGDAGAESTPRLGSRFWFTARLKKNPDKPAPSARGIDGATAETILRQRYSGRRVLVVDDDEVNRTVAKMLLESAGFQVDTAEDGQVAVSRVQTADYELIFMDMQMPTLDGVAATREIRRLPGMQATPIIAITANAFVEDRKNCLDAGMNDFLTKPFDPERLYAVSLKWMPELVAVE